MPEPDDAAAGESPTAPEAKEPWEPPRIESGQLFEANSLACGKSAGDGDCIATGMPFVS